MTMSNEVSRKLGGVSATGPFIVKNGTKDTVRYMKTARKKARPGKRQRLVCYLADISDIADTDTMRALVSTI